MTFRDYLRVARERRVLVVLVTLLFVGTAVAYTLAQTPVYRTEAALEFQSLGTATAVVGQPVDIGGETPEQRAAASAATLIRQAVMERAAKILGGRLPQGAQTSARPEARTNLVIVQGSASTGAGAARLTNAVANAAVQVTTDQVRKGFATDADAQRQVLKSLKEQRKNFGRLLTFAELQARSSIARLEELARSAEPVVLRRRAGVPRESASPKHLRTTLLGLLVGLTLGLVAAFVRDSLDRRFKSSREVTDEMQLPLLGHVPESVLGRALGDGKGRKVLTEDEIEGFRVLRKNIECLDVDAPPKVLLITSALAQEGKSTIATALATAWSLAGQRTLLVECDLRRPTLAARLGIKPEPGLTDYLVGEASPAEVLQTLAPPAAPINGDRPADGAEAASFAVIVAGSRARQPAELLRSARCQSFFDEVKEAYDVVIVDSCPLLSVADTLELLPLSDAVVICVRASKTTRDQASAAKAALSHFPQRPAGLVLTGMRSRNDAAAYGFYSYGSVYGRAEA